MACGCRKNKTVTSSISVSGSGRYEVFRNNVSTGRTFTSLISAESFASRVGGEVRSMA